MEQDVDAPAGVADLQAAFAHDATGSQPGRGVTMSPGARRAAGRGDEPDGKCALIRGGFAIGEAQSPEVSLLTAAWSRSCAWAFRRRDWSTPDRA
ncbi:hypothetical protein CNR27_10030 [Luteimonas chenhongjianii]|uniref:Uncharacterized protein n=1 Tax=Luteimonas chenhongjianii TaxID=2006110 RepID=A0A290XFL7_9GAMM|nr:hypothetical protein CNR27_10030 [Luteimonas chenhongjianii]